MLRHSIDSPSSSIKRADRRIAETANQLECLGRLTGTDNPGEGANTITAQRTSSTSTPSGNRQ